MYLWKVNASASHWKLDLKNTMNIFVVWALSLVQLFATLWTVAFQALLSSTVSWSLFIFMFIESVMLSNHLIFCHPLLLLPSLLSLVLKNHFFVVFNVISKPNLRPLICRQEEAEEALRIR